MSGETEGNVSGWTVDTLHSHVQIQLGDMRRSLERQLLDQREMLDERYATSVKALDAAFVAQQLAMETAFFAADKAVQAALTSAEKAVAKAEAASEKRFEAVNEFRAQLSDQAQTFLSRAEADVRLAALAEKVDLLKDRSDARSADTTKRLDLTQGAKQGRESSLGTVVATASIVGVVVSVLIFVLSRL